MTPDDALPPALVAALDRVDALLQRFERHPDPAVHEAVVELVACLDRVHRAGLQEVVALLRLAGLAGSALSLPPVRLLFDLYDLGEGGTRARVEAVLETLREPLAAEGVQVAAIHFDGDHVRVELASRQAAPPQEIAGLVSQALRDGLPDLARLEVSVRAPFPAESGAVASPAPPLSHPSPGPLPDPDARPRASVGFVPLSSLRAGRGARPLWRDAVPLADLPAGTLRGLVLAGERILVCRSGDAVYAFRDACPGTPLPLAGGHLAGASLVCPWHGCRFALPDGHAASGDGPGLQPLPVAVEQGVVRVGVPVGAPS